jgi:hypothetical protein
MKTKGGEFGAERLDSKQSINALHNGANLIALLAESSGRGGGVQSRIPKQLSPELLEWLQQCPSPNRCRMVAGGFTALRQVLFFWRRLPEYLEPLGPQIFLKSSTMRLDRSSETSSAFSGTKPTRKEEPTTSSNQPKRF